MSGTGGGGGAWIYWCVTRYGGKRGMKEEEGKEEGVELIWMKVRKNGLAR